MVLVILKIENRKNLRSHPVWVTWKQEQVWRKARLPLIAKHAANKKQNLRLKGQLLIAKYRTRCLNVDERPEDQGPHQRKQK